MTTTDELRYAIRALARRPVLLIVTTATLSIGIAANGIIFGVVDQLLLRPAPGLTQPDDLRRVYYDFHREGGKAMSVTTFPVIAALERNVPGMETAAFVNPEGYTLGAGVDARGVRVQLVTGNFFTLLGVRPALGRWFRPDETRIPAGEPVAVVSAGFWRRELAESPDVVGRILSINGRPLTVVGVAPDGFTGVDRSPVDVWVPISTMAEQQMGATWHNQPNSWWVQAIEIGRASCRERVYVLV